MEQEESRFVKAMNEAAKKYPNCMLTFFEVLAGENPQPRKHEYEYEDPKRNGKRNR